MWIARFLWCASHYVTYQKIFVTCVTLLNFIEMWKARFLWCASHLLLWRASQDICDVRHTFKFYRDGIVSECITRYLWRASHFRILSRWHCLCVHHNTFCDVRHTFEIDEMEVLVMWIARFLWCASHYVTYQKIFVTCITFWARIDSTRSCVTWVTCVTRVTHVTRVTGFRIFERSPYLRLNIYLSSPGSTVKNRKFGK